MHFVIFYFEVWGKQSSVLDLEVLAQGWIEFGLSGTSGADGLAFFCWTIGSQYLQVFSVSSGRIRFR